jgi:hypothetical protein
MMDLTMDPRRKSSSFCIQKVPLMDLKMEIATTDLQGQIGMMSLKTNHKRNLSSWLIQRAQLMDLRMMTEMTSLEMVPRRNLSS